LSLAILPHEVRAVFSIALEFDDAIGFPRFTPE